MRITVVGSGGWGTALALVLEENGHDVTLWSHRPEKAEELKRTRENPMLKGVRLPESLHLTADLNAALRSAGRLNRGAIANHQLNWWFADFTP